MGCRVTPYGPSVRNSCPYFTIGAELHIVPNVSRAHKVNTVQPTSMKSPTTRTHGDCTVSDGQRAVGTTRTSTHTTTPARTTTDASGARVRCAGPRAEL